MIATDQSASKYPWRARTAQSHPMGSYTPAPVSPTGAAAGGAGAGAGKPGNYSAQSTWQQPQDVSTTSAINNQLAQGDAAADVRGNLKQLDKAGVSRGQGNYSAAALAGVQARAGAQNTAAQTQLKADQTNAAQRLDYQFGSEMESQKLSMIQHALGQSDWSVQMAQQMAAAKLQAAQQSGALQILNAYV
jgi:hypothetical protein